MQAGREPTGDFGKERVRLLRPVDKRRTPKLAAAGKGRAGGKGG